VVNIDFSIEFGQVKWYNITLSPPGGPSVIQKFILGNVTVTIKSFGGGNVTVLPTQSPGEITDTFKGLNLFVDITATIPQDYIQWANITIRANITDECESLINNATVSFNYTRINEEHSCSPLVNEGDVAEEIDVIFDASQAA